jgi:hypothetical protein
MSFVIGPECVASGSAENVRIEEGARRTVGWYRLTVADGRGFPSGAVAPGATLLRA